MCVLSVLQGYGIIALLTSEIVPIMELLSSMKTHSAPDEVDVSQSLSSHTLLMLGFLYIINSLTKKKNPLIFLLC